MLSLKCPSFSLSLHLRSDRHVICNCRHASAPFRLRSARRQEVCPNGTVSFHTALTPAPRLILSPKQQQPVKIRNYTAVASHNQTAVSYLYLLQELVTFSGLPHFKNGSQLFCDSDTPHRPIPALAHKECGVKGMDHPPKTARGRWAG